MSSSLLLMLFVLGLFAHEARKMRRRARRARVTQANRTRVTPIPAPRVAILI